jgi:4-hydroxybenzoate polyprenyltransferase
MAGTTTAAARPGIGGRALGLLLVTHPLPSALYVLAVGLFSWLAALAAHRPLDPATLARVLVAVACAQAAIGATNDYCDRALDLASRPSKPLVRGLLTTDQALGLAVVCSAAVLLLLPPLGLVALVLGLLVEGLGLAYDLGLKRTPASALLYAVYFPLIPLLAWAVFGRWQPFLPWVLPLGAALGIAMNVANSLPDLEADAAQGVRGLPHLLGPRRGLAVAWAAPPAALTLLWALDLSGAVPAHTPAMLLATAATILSVGAAVALYARNPRPPTLRLTFLIQALGVVALGTGWLAATAF